MKNKLLEAMALGRPIVSTTLGVESLDVEAGRDLLVADDPDGVRRGDRRACSPTQAARSRLGAAARAFVRRRPLVGRRAPPRYRDLYVELARRCTARRRAVPA